MPGTRFIKEAELQTLTEKYPEVGRYDADKNELTTPDGDVIEVELGKIGRSDPVFIKGAVREYLATLDIPELQSEGSASATSRTTSVSLSSVSHRQVVSARSWGAWFKQNIHADPEKVKEAVDNGYAQVEEELKKAVQEEEKARQAAEDAEILKELRALKKKRSEEQLAEMLKDA